MRESCILGDRGHPAGDARLVDPCHGSLLPDSKLLSGILQPRASGPDPQRQARDQLRWKSIASAWHLNTIVDRELRV